MADGHKPHPETDISGDTIEFAAIEPEAKRVCYELHSRLGVRVSQTLKSPIEIRVGQTTESSPLFLHNGQDFPELCAADGADPFHAWVLVQPDVMDEDPKRGWLVITEWTGIGRSETPQFRLGRDVSRKYHIMLGPEEIESCSFEILGSSKNPTRVLIGGDEQLCWYEFNI